MVQEADRITRPPSRQVARFPMERAGDQREPPEPTVVPLAHPPPRHLSVSLVEESKGPHACVGPLPFRRRGDKRVTDR